MQSNEGYVTTDDGVRLFFQIVGSGSQVVLVPNAVHMFDDFHHLAVGRTLVFHDLRNRGRSDSIADPSKLKRGIHHDVDDLETIRRYIGTDQVSLIGHSLLGLMVILYALKYPDHVDRIVQIGPSPPFFAKEYPAHLTGADATTLEVSKQLAELAKEGLPDGPEYREKWWSIFRVLYVADPADAGKITLSAHGLPNELNAVKHLNENIFPSVQTLNLSAEQIATVTAPVLTIHSRKDRQVPYGGGQEWASLLPNARLVTIENAAHLPWIEAPEAVFGSITTFLDREWQEVAEKVKQAGL